MRLASSPPSAISARSGSSSRSSSGATDLIIINHVSGGTIGAYTVTGSITAAGSATITVRNVSTGSLSEAIALRFGLFAGSEN